MKAVKFVNPVTGMQQWQLDGAWVTDPVTVALIEEACKKGCSFPEALCVESQEWTYGIDNTGTNYLWTEGLYEIKLSDGTFLYFEQTTAANGGWTPQMQEWGANIQQAADDAGLLWFVETRFRNPSNPDSLVGGGGFAGPPSVPVSNALGPMYWRYVNIQICPGQPVPVAARIISHAGGPNAADLYAGRDLTTAGPVMGPLQKFWLCVECGKPPVWYLSDAVTLAEAGQIPKCWEPCGTLVLAEAPPERSCEFFFATACDNQNDPDPLSWIQDITRRTTVCNGSVLSVDYFQADPGDPTALLDYDLSGAFVDCASGEPIEDEVLPCTDPVYTGTLWQVDPAAQLATTVDYWGGPAYPGGQTSAPHGNVSDIFTVSADGQTLEHVNGAPSATFLSASGDIRTSNADFIASTGAGSTAGTSGNDQIRVRGYIILNEPAKIKDTNPNTGERGGIWLNKCCAGDLQLMYEDTTDSVTGDTGIFDGVSLPVGRHYFEAVTSDLSSWQGFQLSVSFDDGLSYAPLEIYDIKPKYNCIALMKCVDTGQLMNADTGETVEIGPDDRRCEPPACIADEAAVEILPTTLAAEDFVALGKLYKLSTPTGAGFLRSREWRDTEPASTLTTADSTVLGGEMRERHDFSATPDSDISTYNSLVINDIDNTSSILTVQVIEGFLTLDTAMDFRYTSASEGYNAVEAKVCCGDLELLAEAGGFPADDIYFSLPAGVHYVRIWGIDVAGSNHSATLGYSLDGGASYINDNTPPGVAFSLAKPLEESVLATQNKLSLEISNALTGEVLVPAEWSACSKLCEPCCGTAAAEVSGSSTGTGPTAAEIAEAVVSEERNRTSGRMEAWTNDNQVRALDVPAGTMGCLRSITDYGSGAVYWRIDGGTPAGADDSSTMSVQYGPNINLCGIDLSLVRVKGSSSASDYSVTYEVWS